SFQIVGIVPTGDDVVSIRYGEWGVETDLHIEKELDWHSHFTWFEILGGYRRYQGLPSDQLRAQIIWGYYLFPQLKIIGECNVTYSLSLHEKKFQGPVLILPQNYRLIQTQIKLVWNFSDYGSAFIGSTQNLYGKNVGTEI